MASREDYCAGLHDAAALVEDMAAQAVRCGQGPVDPLVFAKAVADAIRAEANREDTPTVQVKVCDVCGRLVTT